MFKRLPALCILAISISAMPMTLAAQEVVNALCGTVHSIDPAAKTITLITDDGSDGLFKDLTNAKTSLEFDKKIRADATPAGVFKNSGDRVIVYFYGAGTDRTAVAVKDLGPGPFEKISGSVVSYKKNEHLLTLKDSSGAVQSIQIGAAAIAESESGPIQGQKLSPRDGEQVRVIAASANGNKTALFIVQLSL